jgi:hypothetical protein
MGASCFENKRPSDHEHWLAALSNAAALFHTGTSIASVQSGPALFGSLLKAALLFAG